MKVEREDREKGGGKMGIGLFLLGLSTFKEKEKELRQERIIQISHWTEVFYYCTVRSNINTSATAPHKQS